MNHRLAVLGVMAALAVGIGACTNNTRPAEDSGDPPVAPLDSASAAEASEPSAPDAAVDDLVGPGCAELPTDPADPASPAGMADDPVGTAVRNNPQLSTLADALQAANLTGRLDGAASLTVFAPTNQAFETLPAGRLDELTTAPDASAPDSELSALLTFHAVEQEHTAEQLVDAGTLTTLQGGEVEVTGTADAPVINGAPVVCGNIPTANATVFLVGQVLTPPAP